MGFRSDDAFFFFSTGLGWSVLGSLGWTWTAAVGIVCRLWIIGSEIGLYWVGLQALGVALLCKNKKEGGSAGASPVAAQMPKSVPR